MIDVFSLDYLRQMLTSEFFAGGAGLAVVGSLAYYAKSTFHKISLYIYRQLCIRISIDNNDETFKQCSDWFTSENFMSKTNIYKLQVNNVSKRERDSYDGIMYNSNEFESFKYFPGEGWHWFITEKSLVIVRFIMEVRDAKGYEIEDYMRYDIQVFGSSKFKDDLHKILNENKMSSLKENSSAQLYKLQKIDSMNPWKSLGNISQRRLETIITEDDIHLDIIDEINNLESKRSFYEQRGIPFKRGYLLHGSPGCGKSSIIKAIASTCNRNVVPISLNNSMMTDDTFRDVLFECPDNSIIVMEDIDAMFSKRESENKGVSFSGFLNAIDGVASQEGNVIIMTSNHIENLDPALIRPGRVDRIIELKNFKFEEILKMFNLFFENTSSYEHSLRLKIADGRINPSRLQEHLIQHMNDLPSAISSIETIMEPST